MKKMKNKLDERQEQKLLQIEHYGCWFVFWALILSMLFQQMIFGIGEWKYIAGEWIVFMCLALYLCIACLKNGIWDKKLEANPKTNLFVSAGAALVFGILFAIVNYFNFHSVESAFWTFVIMVIVLFLSIFLTLSFSTIIYKKRVRSMEKEFEQE